MLKTVQDLFDYYLATHSRPFKKSTTEDEWRYKLHLSRWSRRWLTNIRKSDVEALRLELGEQHGQVTANRAIALLRAMFNVAIRKNRWRRANPAERFQLAGP